ncbi:glycosyltransferase family 2 protein [Anabaena subtropica]|uniref:Glycosyltransferase family 2 protein n=1 Tax=Anabaena subtropica FACHB-260 TaxID=2692884 RepID=A0ABR8CK61_9NOST|nr:glycosyltransferase family 2 protein [Anabaena subtropica]MBD2343223.1 glycosyltransferase family 2 protein [Anabaena subtropica FACHB-260]
MLVFVIPLKSRQFSKSWERVTQLFERCIKSVCHQTSSEFHVIVVCHEKPDIQFNHPNITYITVDFPQAKDTKYINQGRTDKGRKILKGLVEAQHFSPTHTMAVDADDCVSRNLAEFVKNNPNSNGWVINKGYKYQEGDKYIYVKRNDFYKMCGSCNILRYDLNLIPENPEYNRGYGYYKYYIDHAKVKNILKEKDINIKLLPFPGAIYMLATGENHYYDGTRLNFSIFNRKTLNQSIRDEFGLYDL